MVKDHGTKAGFSTIVTEQGEKGGALLLGAHRRQRTSSGEAGAEQRMSQSVLGHGQGTGALLAADGAEVAGGVAQWQGQ
jgi:hypothetical protein